MSRLITIGSVNCVSTNTDTKLCVYCEGIAPMDAPVYVNNRLGTSAHVTVEIIGRRSVET